MAENWLEISGRKTATYFAASFLPHYKGQIISECPHEIIVYPKIATKIFLGFLSWKFTTSRLVQNRVYLLANRT